MLEAGKVLADKFFDAELTTADGKKFTLPRSSSDEEILQDLTVEEHFSLNTAENSVAMLNAIKLRVAAFAKKFKDEAQDLLSEYKRLAIELSQSTGDVIAELQARLRDLHENEEIALRDSDCCEKLHAQIVALIRANESTVKLICRREFANRLKQARVAANLTQRELAAKIGKTQNNYGGYEQAYREPGLYTLTQLARILKTTPNRLLGI